MELFISTQIKLNNDKQINHKTPRWM